MMEDFSSLSHFRWTFGIILFVYLAVLYGLSLLASRKVRSVEDFVLAGRSLPLGISTFTIIATWFGAESLTTVANEVCDHGVSRAILDPLGVGLCLLLAGSFVAGPLWRSNVMTLGDLFRARYGPLVESLASWILVPSYLGWIAAQLLALATVLQTVFGIPSGVGIVVCAVVGSGYCMMGGMWSVSWTDAAQMGFILLGLLAMAIASFLATGSGGGASTLTSWMGQLPSTHWSILSSEGEPHRLSTAMAALLIGSLGNLPTQDLLQRIMSSRTERVAIYSCWLAGLGYLLLGSLPVLIGLAAAIYEPSLRGDDRDVLMHMATHLLSPVAMMLLLLAIVSTVLSTYSSAVLSPSSVLARNILEPLWERLQGREKGNGAEDAFSGRSGLAMQRWSVVVMVLLAVAASFAGESAYQLMVDSYSIVLVGLFAPFVMSFGKRERSWREAAASMLLGVSCWGTHWMLGWEWFLQPLMENTLPVAQELGATIVSSFPFAAAAVLRGRAPRARDGE